MEKPRQNKGGRRGFVIAAISSGSGKTTVSNGLMRAFTRRGERVQPFKTGPDYIDTIFHRTATGRDSINLDLYFSDDEYVVGLVDRYTRDSDIAIIEGVMGLFDGYDCQKGSAAHISRLTGFPVVLVVNAHSSAYTLAAVLSGFRTFDPSVRIAGVIFNNVASENHLHLLRKAARDSGLPMSGYIMRDKALTVPSRHLGLCSEGKETIESFTERSADAVEKGVDIERLSQLTSDLIFTGEDTGDKEKRDEHADATCAGRCIAVAGDEAFTFIYPENLRSLRRDPGIGGKIVRFSPVHDEHMPDADFLYLPGGYPELYSEELSGNRSMRESIREFVERGGRVWAECGGMLYLGHEIDGKEMCGVLPVRGTMKGCCLTLGYRTLIAGVKEYRGHEFHYSHVEETDRGCIERRAGQTDVRGDRVKTPLYRYRNVLAGYTHLYWGDRRLSELFDELL